MQATISFPLLCKLQLIQDKGIQLMQYKENSSQEHKTGQSGLGEAGRMSCISLWGHAVKSTKPVSLVYKEFTKACNSYEKFILKKVEKYVVEAKVNNGLNHYIQRYWKLDKMQTGREVNVHHSLSYLVQLFTIDSRGVVYQAWWFAHSWEGHSATRMEKLQSKTTTTGYSNGIKDLGKQEQQNSLTVRSLCICSQN